MHKRAKTSWSRSPTAALHWTFIGHPDAIKAFNSEVEAHAHQLALEKHNTDFNSLIKELRGDLDEGLFPDKLMRAWIDAEARENEDLQHAWTNRDQNARTWGQTKGDLQKQFNSYPSRMPDTRS